jgi:1-acyl-sn-glycerol-3-phosphate acyltransferase
VKGLRLRAPFPLGSPTWPTTVPRPPVESRTGLDYDTSWARRYPARLARAVIVDDVIRPIVHLLGSPTVAGLDRIEHLDAPVIFAANHQSHFDTPLLLSTLPPRFRHRTLVAAGADYFFRSRPMGTISALSIGAIPVERFRVNRRSGDLSVALIEDGWSVVIFPEGGRTPDGWAREFRAGAAYLSLRSGAPIVPVHVEGTRRVWKKGQNIPLPVKRDEAVTVTFGAAIRPEPGEDTRHLGARVQDAVAVLADEAASDWWTARRRAAEGATPAITGPGAEAWRRSWALKEKRRPLSSTAKSWP